VPVPQLRKALARVPLPSRLAPTRQHVLTMTARWSQPDAHVDIEASVRKHVSPTMT
jgi:hypothetical protein